VTLAFSQTLFWKTPSLFAWVDVFVVSRGRPARLGGNKSPFFAVDAVDGTFFFFTTNGMLRKKLPGRRPWLILVRAGRVASPVMVGLRSFHGLPPGFYRLINPCYSVTVCAATGLVSLLEPTFFI